MSRLLNAPLELERANHLDQLGAQRARARLEQADDLHGERRAARDDAAVRHELACRAQDRGGVDPGVAEEALVLDVDQQAKVVWRHAFRRGGETPLLVARLEGAQHGAVPVLDDRGGRKAREVGGKGAVERNGGAGEERETGNSYGKKPPALPSPASREKVAPRSGVG